MGWVVSEIVGRLDDCKVIPIRQKVRKEEWAYLSIPF